MKTAPPTGHDDVGEPQRRLLQFVFDRFHKTGEWPAVSSLQVHLEQRGDPFDLSDAARFLDRRLGYEVGNSDVLCLTVRGVHNCTGAEAELADFATVVRLFYATYLSSEGHGRVRAADVRAGEQMDDLRLRKLARLLDTSWLLKGGGQPGDTDWEWDVAPTARYFRHAKTVTDYLDVVDEHMPPPRSSRHTESAAAMPEVQADSIATNRPDIPNLDGLHPLIVAAARALYEDGHYSSAVGAAFQALEKAVRSKSGLTSYGTTMMGGAFGDAQPRLQVRGPDGKLDLDGQAGVRLLMMGAMRSIRNPVAHGLAQHEDPQFAFERLALASLLMRQVDAARRTRPSKSNTR